MTGPVLLNMWPLQRLQLIEEHRFYVEQARARLLSQFANMKQEADVAASAYVAQRSHNFDPDRDDEGEIFDNARDEGAEFYRLLSEMHERTRLSVVAGMYHEWDKKLREWLVLESRYWNATEKTEVAIWQADFVKITALLDGLGLGFSSTSCYRLLNACRLVVNVYKHGKGSAFRDLKAQHPEYLPDSMQPLLAQMGLPRSFDHTQLSVTDVQLQQFSDAMIEFWQRIPDRTLDSPSVNIPKWLSDTLLQPTGKNTKRGKP